MLTFDLFFEQAPIGIAITQCTNPHSSEETIVRINPMYEQITGRKKEELLASGWVRITHPDDIEEYRENFRKLQAGEKESFSMKKRYIKPDGSIVWVFVIVAPLTLVNNEQRIYVSLAVDITECQAIEQALRESERSKSVFLSHLPGLAYRCNYDEEWTMQYVSEGCLNLTGYPPESLLYNRDLSFNDLIAPEYRELLRKEWERIVATGEQFKYEYEIITASGEKKWVLELGKPVFNAEGEVEALEGIVLDISDRKAIEDTLKYNNEHDRWTGLYNRDYLVALLERDLKQKRGIKKALIGINLSTIQLLTLNYGFQYSQNLIKRVAEALKGYCADNRILFRARENRFVFYLTGYQDKEELVDFSTRVVDTLEAIFITERIGGGIGILEIEDNPQEVNADILLRRLLIASERYVSLFGRDFKICFYDEELERMVNRERDIVEALNKIAVGEDAGDRLFLQYQPIVDLRLGSIVGFEALARLGTEKLGVVQPLEFIPLAEKTKLIVPIGEKIIVKALGFLKRLREHGYDDLRIQINISIIQLMQPDFSRRLFTLINQMQVNPGNLGLEITESVFASEYESINLILDELRAAGIYIAIDDFGSGYSSLTREKELKADCIKIDKYFADDLLGGNLRRAIAGDIISMAHKLGHDTIAEGVEHLVQLRYLKEFGCDKIQGFLISEPLDVEEAIVFLEKGHWPVGCKH